MKVRTAALTAFLWGFLVPVIAQACPVCAQGESGGVARKIALGLFIFLPFVVVGAFLFVLRSGLKKEQEQRIFVNRSEA
jgi:hypothetical protein